MLAAAAVALVVPTADATPETDAYDAINAAWEASGGATSPLGASNGDVYPVGTGFAEDFAGGKMFFTPETGAHALYGAILDKFESQGGAANSDLGFPNIDEVPGLVSPDSRVVTFSAADNPVIFWTPEHGAYVVRGVMNAGWDKLGSSTGPLGVPVADETYDGAATTQKFSAGQLSWNSHTKKFTTVPSELADQLADLQVQVDPTVAISQAWRATGGATGPLGARKGEQYPVGADGLAQDFAHGKVYFSPATGANAVEGEILAKYESLGGPAGSELGFPVANEVDGGTPGSRISRFAADDAAIFFTPDNGAFVVRGAMRAAWDKLSGATGALGAPVGDQSIEGDRTSQKFTGGKLVWDRATNTFSTEPADLAKSLSGLQLPGMDKPSSVSTSGTGGALHGNWRWLWVALAVLVLLGALGVAGQWRRQRRSGAYADTRASRSAAGGLDTDIDADDQWSVPGESSTTVRLPGRYGERSGGSVSESELLDHSGPDYGSDFRSDVGGDLGWTSYAGTEARQVDGAGEADDSDTAPTRIPSDAELGRGRHAVLEQEPADFDAGPELSLDAIPLGGNPHDDISYDDISHADISHDDISHDTAHPMMHLPLEDPYQAPDGYPVKANVGSGLYYTEESALYDDTLAEIWFADEESAQLNGFVRAQ